MRKMIISAAAAAALATGLLAATGLYAQETGRQEMPGGMMGDNQQGGMMGQGDMEGQGMMPMMGMMQQMSQMMQTCNNMMQGMVEAQEPAGSPAQPDKQG